MDIAIIGLGLIGGSLALDLKEQHNIFGIDNDKIHQKQALELSLVTKIISIEKISEIDVVIIAVPVDVAPDLCLQVLDAIKKKCLVIDVGSTKQKICKTVENHKNRKNFLATHPIAGTEFSGPNAAIKNLFTRKVNIICEKKLTAKKQFEKFIKLFAPLQMRYVFMESAKQHDKHIAYVSHLSHISSFMLGKTVLEIEKEEKNIFNMAGSGFESTVRLAKSSAKTWTPIFTQNKEHILKSLNEYIKNLEEFKMFLIKDSKEDLYKTIESTNHIKDILNGIK